MNQISISNIVNVNISDNPSILGDENLNTIAIFTKEDANYPINNYVIFKTASECAQFFGLESQTYKAVSAIYNQSLNIQAGDGYVVVIPLKKNVSIDATSGYFKSDNLILDLWNKVTDGSFTINVDGTETEITNCDFSNVKSFEELATYLQTKIGNSVNVVANDNTITIISKTTGASSSVNISGQLASVDYFNVNQSISVQGADAYTGEEQLQDAVIRASEYTFFEGIIASFDLSDNEILKTANAIQSMNKIFVACLTDLNDLSVADEIKNKSFNKTRILYNGMGESLEFACGYLSKVLSINFNGNNTVYNIANKEIVGIQPDTTINDNILTTLKSKGIDCYANVKGLGTVMCSGENEWVDVVLFKNWVKSALEVAGYNLLRTTNVIPQTNNGVTVVENCYRDVLERGKTIGFISAGKWLLNYTFGDQETFLENIKNEGYYIYSTPIDNITMAQRNTRSLNTTQIAIKLAGAFNSLNIIVNINK